MHIAVIRPQGQKGRAYLSNLHTVKRKLISTKHLNIDKVGLEIDCIYYYHYAQIQNIFCTNKHCCMNNNLQNIKIHKLRVGTMATKEAKGTFLFASFKKE